MGKSSDMAMVALKAFLLDFSFVLRPQKINQSKERCKKCAPPLRFLTELKIGYYQLFCMHNQNALKRVFPPHTNEGM